MKRLILAGALVAAPALAQHEGHRMQMPTAPAAPAPSPGPPPLAPGDENAADRYYDPVLMALKRSTELTEMHGGFSGSMILLDQFEVHSREGRDGYKWDGQGWYGGDVNRLWVKSEGEGDFGNKPEQAEVQALYSRAIGPFFNFQAGVRHDFRPDPDRTHLVVGVEGLARYWFEVDGALFLSNKGELTARLEAEYDQRITNRLFLQPAVEFNLSAQDAPAIGLGAGLSSIEAGLRLRYEIVPEVAPYVGVEYERKLGGSARFARLRGDDPGGWNLVAGVRLWF
jgi:copper resistance protein B